jgi:hypothetical protein
MQGTTDRCHPKTDTPPGWLISHSENHWSNITTMLEYLHKVLVPYRLDQIDKLGLKKDQKVIFFEKVNKI